MASIVDGYHIRITQIFAPFGMIVRVLDEWVKATIPSIAITSAGNRDFLNTAPDHMTDESMSCFMIGVVHTSPLIGLCGGHFHLPPEKQRLLNLLLRYTARQCILCQLEATSLTSARFWSSWFDQVDHLGFAPVGC